MSIQFKKWLCFLLAAILVCGLFGCAEKEVLTPYSICQKILPLYSREIQWKSLDSDSAATYYGVSSALLEKFSVYISDDDTRYDAVAVFTFKNREEKLEIARCFTESLNSNKASASVVNAAESAKIEKGIIMELDDMLILVISENSEIISKELIKLGAKNYSY